MEETWSVYRHTFPDGKVYIGITKNAPEERWGPYGTGYQGQPKIFNAILANGWNNIRHEVLFSGLSAEEAAKKERDLIIESDKDGACGNYNVVHAKSKTVPKATCYTGDSAIVTEDTLYKHGRYLYNLPDIFYDRIIEKYGISPFSVHLEEKRVIFEIWKEIAGGYEFTEYGIPYPKERITFAEIREMLISGNYAEEAVHSSIFTKKEIERNLALLRGSIS